MKTDREQYFELHENLYRHAKRSPNCRIGKMSRFRRDFCNNSPIRQLADSACWQTRNSKYCVHVSASAHHIPIWPEKDLRIGSYSIDISDARRGNCSCFERPCTCSSSGGFCGVPTACFLRSLACLLPSENLVSRRSHSVPSLPRSAGLIRLF